MGNLKTEHEELKTMFNRLKKIRENSIIDEHHLKNKAEATIEPKDLDKPDVDVKHRIMLKRPARLLPLSLFKRYAVRIYLKTNLRISNIILEIFHF